MPNSLDALASHTKLYFNIWDVVDRRTVSAVYIASVDHSPMIIIFGTNFCFIPTDIVLFLRVLFMRALYNCFKGYFIFIISTHVYTQFL